MTKNAGNWVLHRRALTGPIRATTLASTAAFALLVSSITAANFELARIYLVIVIALYLGACVLLTRAFILSTKAELSIIVHDGVLSIPRAFVPPYSVDLREIKSVEKFGAASLLIGRFHKSPIWVNQRNFESNEAFNDFAQFLTPFATGNHSPEVVEEIKIVTARREAEGSAFISLLALSLLATYAISAAGIEQISENAVSIGGLIKGTVVRNEVYRIASSFFLHLTPFHLGLNILALAIVSQQIQALVGRVRLINILFSSAIAGALLSLWLSPCETVIGASGGIFGLFGAYFFVCVTSHQRLPGSVSGRPEIMSLALALQLLSDLMSEAADIFSHVGGFMCGLLYARLVLRRYVAATAAAFSFAELCVAVGLTLAYAAGLTYFLVQYAGLR